jgi:thiazole synthase ThiGH ThiG subunit
MSEKKQSVKAQIQELQTFLVPEYGVAVEAEDAVQAAEIAKKQAKGNNE